jgi:hypothetical protein
MRLLRTITSVLVLFVAAEVGAEFISEETPPTSCGNKLVVGVNCRGNWCDEIEPICGGGPPHAIYDVRWTRFVSEEDPNEVRCAVSNPWEPGDWPGGAPAFITGFACNGSNCDNVALECVALSDAFPRSLGGSDCGWTDWVSEENGGTLRFPDGNAAIAMQCRGGRCDDKRFLVCPIQSRR